MQKRYTLAERILSDTPAFFRRVQIFGIGLVSLGTSLSQVIAISGTITTALITAGTTLTIIAQFAVDQSKNFTDKTHDDVKRTR